MDSGRSSPAIENECAAIGSAHQSGTRVYSLNIAHVGFLSKRVYLLRISNRTILENHSERTNGLVKDVLDVLAPKKGGIIKEQ